MKQISIFTLLLVLIASCIENSKAKNVPIDTDNDLTKNNLSGQVKSIKEYKAYISSNNKIEKRRILYETNYTKFGNIIEEKGFDKNGNLELTYTYEFNQKNIITKSKFENTRPGVNVFEIAEYDNKGRDSLTHGHFENGTDYIEMFEYDSLSSLIKHIVYEENDTLVEVFEYQYNDQKKITQEKQLKNKKTDQEEYIVDFKYDSNGNLIERVDRSKYMSEMKSIKEYDSNNKLIRNTDFVGNQVVFIAKFDKYENPIWNKRFVNGKEATETKLEYEYDQKGNWIKRKISLKQLSLGSDKFIPAYVETREIKYY